MSFIKYRLVDMYNSTLFQVDSMKEYKRGKLIIDYINNDIIIYRVDIGSFAYVDIVFDGNHMSPPGISYKNHIKIRLDGDHVEKRNKIFTINKKLTTLEKKIFHKSIELYVKNFNDIGDRENIYTKFDITTL